MFTTSTVSALAGVALLTSALFGPPSLTVRQATPGMRLPAGAVLLVNTEHHAEAEGLTVSARAEGLVQGKRVSKPLQLVGQRSGNYAVLPQWAKGTPWVLVFVAEQGPDGKHGIADAIVKVDVSGTIVSIEYPQHSWTDMLTKPNATTSKAVEVALKGLASR